jgi:hypothetical protein
MIWKIRQYPQSSNIESPFFNYLGLRCTYIVKIEKVPLSEREQTP